MICAAGARRVTHGFTLLELLVTLAIMLIVLAFGSGPFGAMMAQNRLTTTVNDFVGSLTLARSMAVMGNGAVTICSNNGGACGSATDWAKGALLFNDPSELGGTGMQIRKRLDVPTGVTILSNVKAIVFYPDGSAALPRPDALSRPDALPDVGARWVFCAASGDASPRVISVTEIGANYLYKPSACTL